MARLMNTYFDYMKNLHPVVNEKKMYEKVSNVYDLSFLAIKV